MLIDAQPPTGHGAPPRQTATHGTLDDAVGFLPGEAQSPRHRRRRCLFEPGDREAFKQHRKPRMRRGPRHRHCFHAVLRAPHTGDFGVEPRLVLAGIEVPPAALDVIVERRDGLAVRTRKQRPTLLRQPDVHRLRRVVQLDSRDLPWPRHAENRCI